MTYSIDQLKAMCPLHISECSQKHVQSVVAELIETALSSAASTLAQPASVPGFVLVPVEPTQEMLDAVVTTVDDLLLGSMAERQYREDWAAMLAAAPAATQPAQATLTITAHNGDKLVCHGSAADMRTLEYIVQAKVAATQPKAQPHEHAKAISEGTRNAAADGYFAARGWMMDTAANRRLFEAGFDRGWKAAPSAQAEQIRELREALDHLTHDVEAYFGEGKAGPNWPKYLDAAMYLSRAALSNTKE